MPSIDNDILDCVIYLYPTEEDAGAGTSAGGTGFLVSIPTGQDVNREHLYAVTNAHVVGQGEDEGRSPVIRLNTHQGNTDVFPLGCEHWIPHPEGVDLAIYYFGIVKRDIFQYQAISITRLITKDWLRNLHVGPGDDVFMVGRFFLHEGIQRNTPALRFGSISMMPNEPVRQPSGVEQESFIVEMRSHSGYSGSPVFLHHPYPMQHPSIHIDQHMRDSFGPIITTTYPNTKRSTSSKDAWLLGVDWGHLREYDPVYKKMEGDADAEPIPVKDLVIKANLGQSGVVPAWELKDFICSEVFTEMGEEAENDLREKKPGSRFVLDVKKPSDFISLAKR